MEQLYRYDWDYWLKGKTGEEGIYFKIWQTDLTLFIKGKVENHWEPNIHVKHLAPHIRENKEITQNKDFLKKKPSREEWKRFVHEDRNIIQCIIIFLIILH